MSSVSRADIETRTPSLSLQDLRLIGYRDVWLFAFANLLKNISTGQMIITLPNGQQLKYSGQKALDRMVHLRIHDLRAFRMILKNSDVGLGESYLKGYWDCDDLCTLIELAILNESAIKKAVMGKWVSRFVDFAKCLFDRNTKRGSRRNIAHHYDLGNAFYQKWLDPSMTYSAALFEDDTEDLAKAQEQKYAMMADVAGVVTGSSVLEIGCGWGGFAEHVLKIPNTSLTGLTLSKEQLNFANDRLMKMGSSIDADLRLEDYRDHHGSYDAIVSIEMFEAVGMENWPAYFSALKSNLKPGGRAAVQVITIEEDRFERYQKFPDFIQKYIFPGGFLPTKKAFQQTAEATGFTVEIRKKFGGDYAKTLCQWNTDFQRDWPVIEAMGFDDRFKRMWEFYLQYCEAGFRQKTLDVVIFELH